NASLPKKFVAYPKYRVPQAKPRYAEIAATLKLPASTEDQGVQSLIKAVADLKAKVGMPATIKEAGVARADFDKQVKRMAEVAFDDQCVGANPCYPRVKDLVGILWEAYGE
ncbi:MAG: iron-containing alcohol dehydrogenase, partial [Planctomycetes bacterium]|nr:iron-containing alcohol dehydrogenase [Planctomycetota bacterium]